MSPARTSASIAPHGACFAIGRRPAASGVKCTLSANVHLCPFKAAPMRQMHCEVARNASKGSPAARWPPLHYLSRRRSTPPCRPQVARPWIEPSPASRNRYGIVGKFIPKKSIKAQQGVPEMIGRRRCPTDCRFGGIRFVPTRALTPGPALASSTRSPSRQTSALEAAHPNQSATRSRARPPRSAASMSSSQRGSICGTADSSAFV